MEIKTMAMLLKEASNLYIEKRNYEVLYMYEQIRLSLPSPYKERVPMSPLPWFSSEKFFEEILKNGMSLETLKLSYYSQEELNREKDKIRREITREFEAIGVEIDQGAKECERNRIKNMSWWRRLWKRF